MLIIIIVLSNINLLLYFNEKTQKQFRNRRLNSNKFVYFNSFI